MKTWSIAVLCVIAISLSFAPQAMAQCPAGLPSPVFLLAGTSWAFQWTADDALESLVGIFNAQVDPTNFLTGVLNVTMTTNDVGIITRQQHFQGRYQVYPGCSGGELLLNAGGNAFQFEFVFVSGKTEMYFVSDNTAVPNNGLGPLIGGRGRAKLTPENGCPAGVTPLQLLAGTN